MHATTSYRLLKSVIPLNYSETLVLSYLTLQHLWPASINQIGNLRKLRKGSSNAKRLKRGIYQRINYDDDIPRRETFVIA